MSVLSRTNHTLRPAALLLLGALVVHWLRYLLAYGSGAGGALERQGHNYLTEILPALVALAAALLVAATLLRLVMAAGRGKTLSLVRAGGGYALALLAVYSAQELSEGALAAGHASGFAGVTGQGGWLAVPLAAAFGAVLACAGRVLASLEEHVIYVLRPFAPRRCREVRPRPPTPLLRPLTAVLLRCGRPPRAPPSIRLA